jgi:putative membrane protein
MKFLVNILISALAVAITAFLIPGIQIDGIFAAVLVAGVMALLNRFVKPVLTILTMPISFLTLGLFYLVINVLMVYLAAWIVKPGFTVEGFFPALFFSIVLSVVNSLLDSMAGD